MSDWPEGINLGLAVPLNWTMMSKQTHVCLMCLERPDFIYLDTPRGGDIGEIRDAQVKEALKLGCTHIFFVDSDMTFPPHTLKDMFRVMEQEKADMVGGLIYRGYPPFEPMIWNLEKTEKMVPYKDFRFGDIIDSGMTGLGCMLIKSRVFDELAEPWFRLEIVTGVISEGDEKITTKHVKRGEDTFFTRKATDAGFKLKIMTKYDIGHLREFCIDRDIWLIMNILGKLGSWEKMINLMEKLENKDWIERELGN